jgi:D-alanyl-D-alanine dipeptidase
MGNGTLDTSTLVQIDGEPGDLLRRDAAGYWNALQRDFRRDMGYGLGVREAYRPLSVQIGYFVTRYTKTSRNTGIFYDGTYWAKKAGVPAAARPGTSKHGDGLAVDAAINTFTEPAYRWLAANAGRYGFGNNQGKTDGEPWHWVFGETRPSAAPAALDIEEIDMPLTNDDIEKVSQNILNVKLANPANGGTPTSVRDLIRYGEFSDIKRRDEIVSAVNGALMPRLAQIVEWLDGRFNGSNAERSAEADELLAALKAVAPGDTTVLADLTPVLAAVESLKASLPDETRKALAAALAS